MPSNPFEFAPQWTEILLVAFVSAILILSFIGISALFYIWAERKVSGRIQDRLGPTRTGPYGLLQSLADGVKLVAKEDARPDAAEGALFRLAPYLAFCATFAGFIALPFGDRLVAVDLSVGVFFVLAVLSSEVFGVMLAGFASANKWSMFGGIREAAQVVSYEIPRSLCVVVPVCLAGSLSLTEFSRQQVGGFWNWYVFHDPFTSLAFLTFFVTATASCKRAPFDLAEAESELVAGFHTEYSGLRWSYFYLAEYGSMFAMGALASHLFLGGWHSGLLAFELTDWLGFWPGNFINTLVLITKSTSLVIVMMWMRWSLPRLRIDQVMTTCLKYVLPVSCCLLVGVCVWQIFVPPALQAFTRYVLAFGSIAVVLVVLVWVSREVGGPPKSLIGGVWSGEKFSLARRF